MSERTYYYDVSTGEVHDDERRGQARDQLGPYATREEAQRALQSARERTEAEDRRDAEEEW